MLRFLLVFSVFLILIAILTVSVLIGRIFGRKQIKNHPKHKLEVLGVAESSVFALLALLIAFTFSGAYDRFEHRKMLLLDQANAFDKVMYNIDLVPSEYRSLLRADTIKYINIHLDAYHAIPHMSKVEFDLNQALLIEEKIWATAIKAAEQTKNDSLAAVFIESINSLFDEMHTGINTTKMHAPAIIFILMIGLAALGGFLIGYDAAETKQKHPIHITFYILLTAVTIYIIINLEFPRIGFIHSGSFDQLLVDVRDHTNNFARTLE